MDLPLLFFAVKSLSFSLNMRVFLFLLLIFNRQFIFVYTISSSLFSLFHSLPLHTVMKNSRFNPVMINLYLSPLPHMLFCWAANFSTPISVHYLNIYFALNCLFGGSGFSQEANSLVIVISITRNTSSHVLWF